MKTILFIILFLLNIFVVTAEDTNKQGKLFVIIISVDKLSLTNDPVVTIVTNYLINGVITNYDKQSSEIKKLETEIKLKEKRFHELYDGIPEAYTGNGTPESGKTLDKLQQVWYSRDKDKLEIDAKKKELESLRKK